MANQISNSLSMDAALKKLFVETAVQEAPRYLEQIKLSLSDDGADLSRILDKIWSLSTKLLSVEKGHVLAESASLVLDKCPKSFELQALHKNFLQLLLFLIEKQLGFKAPELPSFVHIKQEQPIITPQTSLNSNLYQNLYALIEQEIVLDSYIDNPQKESGVLVLWLILKEGISNITLIKDILSQKVHMYRIRSHWFVDDADKRFYLSPKGTLLLAAWTESEGHCTNPMKAVQELVTNHRIITPIQKLKAAELKEALKLEQVLTQNPLSYAISNYRHKSAHLSKNVLYRIFTNEHPKIIKEPKASSTSTVRQARAWYAASKLTSELVVDSNIQDQLETINEFIEELDNLPVSKGFKKTKPLRRSLRSWLEESKNVKQTPYCWMLLSWFYKLLESGGSRKKSLKYKTIKSYMNYVCPAILLEFTGCDFRLMDGETWATKINIAAEQIQAPSKKAYLLYFAEHLIGKELVPDLCFSDIDIPSHSAQVSASLITQNEADRVLKLLNENPEPEAFLARLIFMLGFYAGLRRGEIKGLQYKDFIYNCDLSYFILHVRPNAYRSLKSPESARNLPLEVLLSSEHCAELHQYLRSSKSKYTKQTSKIFNSDNAIDKAFTIVTAALRGVTADESLRFHHCRHSFCNWIWARLNINNFDDDDRFPFLDHEYFSHQNNQRLFARYGIEPYSRKLMWVLAEMLGHASPSVTISSYFHLAEIMRRAMYGNHRPTQRLLQRFWGQKTKVDQWFQPIRRPSNAIKFDLVMPEEFEPVLCLEPFSWPEAIDITESDQKNLTLALIWRILRRLAVGQSHKMISQTLGVSQSTSQRIWKFETLLMERGSKRSKYTLASDVNYEKLNRNDTKVLEFYINRFDKYHKEGRFSKLNLNLILPINNSITLTKDNLIRTCNKDAGLTLLKMVSLMGLKSYHLRVKWYFPNEQYYQKLKECNYAKHFDFWQKAISEHCGFEGMEITAIVPKTVEEQARAHLGHRPVKISDERRFLGYSSPGWITIEILDRHKRKKGSEQKERVRSRATVSFLRLLGNYCLMNENLSI